MSVKIRTATQSDLPVILQYIHDLAKYEKAPDEVELSLDDLKDSLFGPNPQVFCLISEQDNETTGFAVWHLNYSTWLGKHGIYLEDLYVDPKFRGQGHGKALLQKLAQICIENGYKRLQWWVLDWNESATVPENLIRFSVGIENVDDLWADIQQALTAAKIK